MRDVLFWSGGKDAWVALQSLLEAGRRPILLTTCSSRDGWLKFQGVNRRHIRAQADAMGLESKAVEMPDDASNEVYLQAIRSALDELDAKTLIFGDLFLDDIRRWREASFSEYELEFPNWGMGSSNLAYEVWNRRAEVYVTGVLDGVLGPERAGEKYTPAFAASLPEGVDPAGENGEFHTFVSQGGWVEPIELEWLDETWSDGFMHYALDRD